MNRPTPEEMINAAFGQGGISPEECLRQHALYPDSAQEFYERLLAAASVDGAEMCLGDFSLAASLFCAVLARSIERAGHSRSGECGDTQATAAMQRRVLRVLDDSSVSACSFTRLAAAAMAMAQLAAEVARDAKEDRR